MNVAKKIDLLTFSFIPFRIAIEYASRIRGLKIVENLIDNCNSNRTVYILPWPSIGDSVAVEMFLDKQQQPFSVIVTPSERSSIVPARDGWRVVTLNLRKVRRIVKLSIFAGSLLNLKIAHYGVKYIAGSINRNLIGYKNTTYFNCLSDVVFKGASWGKGDHDIYESGDRMKDILLCPESRTLETPHMKFWMELESRLSAEGFRVRFNITHPSKVASTQKIIHPEMREMKEVFCKFRVIVSARSGIVDYIWDLKTQKIILYPFDSRLDWGCGRAIDAWSTKSFDKSDSLTEIEWKQDSLSQVVDQIVNICNIQKVA